MDPVMLFSEIFTREICRHFWTTGLAHVYVIIAISQSFIGLLIGTLKHVNFLTYIVVSISGIKEVALKFGTITCKPLITRNVYCLVWRTYSMTWATYGMNLRMACIVTQYIKYIESFYCDWLA